MNEFLIKMHDYVKQARHILVSTHLSADGDALGSLLAVSLYLEQIGKKHRVIIHDAQIDHRFDYLAHFDRIECAARTLQEEKPDFDCAVIVDVPGRKRMGDSADLLKDVPVILKIDHHPAEDDFTCNFVDEQASSAAALVYEWLEAGAVRLNKSLADALYTGIISDTGRLSYSNTRARDLEICARLVEAGVEVEAITNQLFFNNPYKALRVVGLGLVKMQQALDGRLAYTTLPLAALQGVDQSDLEELANYPVSVRGAKVGAYIREIEPDFYKISLRSRSRTDVRKVAQEFNGGGHYHAAGCRFKGTKQALLDKLISAVEKQLLAAGE
ncbi:MAG: bifunctional oligoribonuclease/PAP phosphatase NrnA [Calditrichaeota bacterium]|nr:MAG: bifunctional oligoribonuclease/PAP phosphatase NrnA [Calditrichota bacterium]